MEPADPLTTRLPALYATWLDELLDGPVPVETKATCSNCAMLPPADGPIFEPGHYFSPKIKCCSYIPTLSNFLVGRILADEQPDLAQGRQSTLARLQNPELANPLWLERSSVDDYQYDHRHDFYGQIEEMVCPHYIDEEGGLCGIWRHRNGMCATWFCKYTRGAVGHRFWLALRDLLMAVEHALAQWCALKLDIPLEAVRDLGRPSKRGETIRLLEIERAQPDLSTATRQRIWGAWHGRETEYYVECARLVEALTWSEVLAVCGPDVQALARLVQQAHEQHRSDKVPDRLRPGQVKIISMAGAHVIVESYLGSDPLKIPRRIFDLLSRFDGRPTPEVITGIALTTGLKVNPSLVRKLVDFKILVPLESP